MNDYPLITLITVSYNAASEIEKTILSVINQSYAKIEYIIVDGGSNDGTLSIIRKYMKYIACSVSESDNGIYDAMNKAIKLSKGDFLLFLNAGDFLYTNTVIELFAKKISEIQNSQQSIYLGDIFCVYNELRLGVVKSKALISPWYMPPHQGVFFSRILLENILYDDRFKYLGDRELILRMKNMSNCILSTLGFVVSEYNLNGISSKRRNSMKIFHEAVVISDMYAKHCRAIVVKEYFKAILKYISSYCITDGYYFYFLYALKKITK